MHRSLVVFARAPELGRVKTRLAASVGEQAAYALYRGFLDDTLAFAAEGALRVGARLVLACAGPIDHPDLVRLAETHRAERVPQPDGDLGRRMETLLERERAGEGAVCIIGSDSPTLGSARIVAAFDALRSAEVVVGPGIDGGYWLIGARRAIPELFAGMPWSTDGVLEKTLQALAGRSAALLDFHYDVDDVSDLTLLERHLAAVSEEVAPATRKALATVGVLGPR